jgi:stage V sporulation protein D (sporulation-specific penicillin-binding protein)
MMNARYVSRVRLITFFAITVAVVLIGRLYYLQIVQGKAYAARASAQFVQPSTPLTDRDSIYFTDKDGNQITAAALKDGFTLAINPTKVVNAESLYKTLNALVPLDHATFIAKATKPNTQYQVVAQELPTDLGQQIQSKSLAGVVLANDRWRYYPGGSLAAQTLGFVAYNGDTQEGRYGLESFYNDTLTRTDDNLYSNFFVQLFGAAKNVLAGQASTGDIITTIEPSVQAQLERELVSYDDVWHPALAGGIIMDPQTGEIIAMASSPTFDLNNFGQSDPTIFGNPMVQNVYEMGSIIKPLTMAAGIDSGAVTPTTTYNDTGCITVDTKKICNYDLKARGVIPMQQILSQSLNVGASFIATQMGPSVMRDYFVNHYQLGSSTGIDLPAEQAGLVNNIETTSQSRGQVEFDTASFGQGIAITPVETVRALATLANGGKLVTPHVASAIHYDSGITKNIIYPAPVQVLKPDTSLAVTRMLTTVVDTVLDNGKVKMDHYSIAAKTGTAQIANPAGGGYYANEYLHSYFGYLPSYSPKFIIFLFAFKPVGAPYASETWSDPFIDLTHFLVNYYDLPPDR